MTDTPRVDALRTSDYILTRNDCFMGMEKYRDLAARLERELGVAVAALEPLCTAVEEYCGESLWPRTRLREAVAKGRAALASIRESEQ